MDKDAQNRKCGRSTIFGGKKFLDLNEYKECFCQRVREGHLLSAAVVTVIRSC